jgi:hypothetical protein
MLKHKHHIIPKHAGGTNDSSNIIELTPEEHANAHKELWEKHGKWQDYIAWQGLSKRMSKEEIIREKARLGNIGRDPWHKGKKLGPRPEEVRKKISETMRTKKIKPSEETIKKALEKAHIAVKGRVVTEEERKQRSDTLKQYNKDNPRPYRPRSESASLKTAKKLCKAVLFRDIKYNSLKECKELTGLTRYWIVNDPSFKYL